MKIVAPEKWIPCDGIELEENANSAVRTNANILVVAGPGAGKTELLAQKASYLFQTNYCRAENCHGTRLQSRGSI